MERRCNVLNLEVQNLVEMYGKYGENEDRFIENTIVNMSNTYINHIIYRYKNKEYYEDLRQELIISVIMSIRKYKHNKNTSFETYCYKAMNNTLIRKLRYQRLIRIPEYLDWKDYSKTIVSNLNTNKDGTVLDIYDRCSKKFFDPVYTVLASDFIKNLNDKNRKCLLLKALGYSGEEISRITGNTPSQIKTKIYFIREKWRKYNEN